MPSPYYMTNFFQYERCLPMLYIIFNDRKNISYSNQYKNIFKNQQILVTAYDIYNTISNLLYGDKYILIPNKTFNKNTPKSKHGISLLNEINSKNRHPNKFNNTMVIDVCI